MEKLKAKNFDENVMKKHLVNLTELPGFLGYEKVKDFIIKERIRKNEKANRQGTIKRGN